MPGHLRIRTVISLFCDTINAELIISNDHIRPFLDKKTRQLSGGEKRLVEIFLILHSEAKYILIDEPFNGIAPIYKEEIKLLIKKISVNKGFIVTDHDYRNILDIASKTILIDDGGTKVITNKDDLVFWKYLPKQLET